MRPGAAIGTVLGVPLDLLRGVPFPLAGDHYNIPASRPAAEAALKALASALELWEDDARLVPSRAIGQLAPLSDRSFEDYDRAVAQVAEPLAPDTVIAYEQGYLDAHFVYPISSPKSVFSIETRLGAELGDYIKLTIRFIPLGEPSRAMMITGASGRVAQRYGAATAVLDWSARLVCSRCGSRQIDMVVTGERR
jgi:hypothetical protein